MQGTRFIADSNVGRLGKWLRLLGWDTVYDAHMADEEIVRRALREDRVILTRDTGICARKIVRKCVLLRSDDTMQQLSQVIHELDLELDPDSMFRLCPVCNEQVLPAEKEAVADRIPRYVRKTQTKFTECPVCRRVYWHGTHVDHILEALDRSVCGCE